MVKSIVVIGLGTLGGFVVEALSNLEGVEKIVIIDHDTVEKRNLKNSIYRQIDIGISKVEALTDIINEKNSEIEILGFKSMYIEGETKLPKTDLILDCRDYTYNRKSEIDARLYISSRYLIVDCRKNVNYKIPQPGKYLTELTKDDLRYASSTVSMLVHSNTIQSLMNNQAVQKYELDYVKHIDKYMYDIVYDNVIEGDKFINLPEKIVPILDMNKKKDIQVFLGSRVFPVAERVIPKKSLTSSRDLIVNLASVINLQCEFNNFIISVFQDGSKVFVELIPETGAA